MGPTFIFCTLVRRTGHQNKLVYLVMEKDSKGRKGSFPKVISPQFAEKIAMGEFDGVGDEGLFPNHSDKDIWVAGFKAAIDWMQKHHKATNGRD